MNHQSLTYKALVHTASAVTLQLLGFVYRMGLAFFLGAQGMGAYTLSMQHYTILASVCIYGLSTAVTASVARHGALHATVRKAVGMFLGLYALSAGVVLSLFGADSLLLLACILLTGFENILKGAFLAIGRVRVNAVSEVGELLLRTLLVCLLLATGVPKAVFWGMTLAEVYAVCFLFARFRRLPPSHGKTSGFFKQALPCIGISVISNALPGLTTLAFPLRHSVADLGIIHMAQPLILLPVCLISALSGVLMPGIAATRDRRRMLVGVFAACAVCALILACTPFLPAATLALYGETVPRNMAVLLGLQACAVAFESLAVCLLHGLGHQNYLFFTAFLCEAVQFLLAWYLPGVTGYLLGILAGDVLRLCLYFGKIAASLRN